MRSPAPLIRESCRCAVWSLLRFGLCVFLVSLVFSLVALPWLELPWWKVFRRCVSIAAALSLWFWIRKLERRTFQSYGLSISREGGRHLLVGTLLGIVALALCLGVGLASGACQIAVTQDRLKLWGMVVGFILPAFLVSILEELIFRGFILQHLLACSRPLAVVISSALYAVVHVKTGTFTLATWREFGGLFLLGAVLSTSYLATRQLALAVGLHAVLAYGARVNKVLVAFSGSAMSWVTGTSRLIDGLFNWGVLLGLGGIIVWWVRLSRRGGRHEER